MNARLSREDIEAGQTVLALVTATASGDKSVLEVVLEDLGEQPHEVILRTFASCIGVAAGIAVWTKTLTGVDPLVTLGQHYAQALDALGDDDE